jgi:hypothetical protein
LPHHGGDLLAELFIEPGTLAGEGQALALALLRFRGQLGLALRHARHQALHEGLRGGVIRR